MGERKKEKKENSQIKEWEKEKGRKENSRSIKDRKKTEEMCRRVVGPDDI